MFLGNVEERALHPQNTHLTTFFQLCQSDEFASTLLYNQNPKYYKWDNEKNNEQRKIVS